MHQSLYALATRGDRELERLPRRQLSERVAGIDDERGAAIADDRAGARARDRSLVDTLDVHGQEHHAVRRNAFEIGGDQIRRDQPRVRGGDAHSREDIADGRDQPLRVDRDGAGRLGRHQRASSSLLYQDGRCG